MIRSMYEIAAKSYQGRWTVSVFDVRLQKGVPMMQQFSMNKHESSSHIEMSWNLVVNNPDSIPINGIYNYGNEELCVHFGELVSNLRKHWIDNDPSNILISNGETRSKLIITELGSLNWALKFIRSFDKKRTIVDAYAKDMENIKPLNDAFLGVMSCSNPRYNELNDLYKRMYKEAKGR